MIGKHIPRRETSSFERLNDYVLNRSGRGEDTHKVLYSGHFNLLGDLNTATYEMESVAAKNTRVKIPADHFLLSWRAGEQPTEAQACEAVKIALDELDLSQNQCVWALHQNTENVHLHIAVNRIDVQTYRPVAPAHGWTRKAMERAARRIEFAQGWQVEHNAWSSVDENGTIIEAPHKEPDLIEDYNIPQRVVDKENHTGEKSAIRTAKDKLKKFKPTSWAELHEQLAALGMSYEKKGSGAVIFVGDVAIKASDAGKRFALNALEKKLGAYEPPAIVRPKEQLAPEPLTRKNDNADWRAYEAYRNEYYKNVENVRDAMRAHIDKAQKQLSAAQKQERDEHINCRSWKGRGAELNAIRSELAAKHARERLDLKEHHSAMRKKCRELYPPVPSYEEWLRLNNKDLDAEAWRHRADKLFDVATLTPPIDFAGESEPVKDLRGFTSSVRKHCVAFTAKNGSSISFIDYGKQIRIYELDSAAVLAALQLGMQKWGSVRIDGPESYKKMCVELAARNGIKLSPKSLQQQVWAYQDAQLKREREIDPSRVDGAREAFERYHAAVGADHYRVTATQFFKNGGKRGFMVNRQDGAPDGYTAEQLADAMPRLVSLEQTDNRNIYFTPISETKHHLVIDDLSPESLAEMLSDGYEPCAIIETSPNNWQAVITIPKAGTSLDRLAANEIVAELNKKFGDPKFSGEVHAHRAPSFENLKPTHERPDGTHPETKLVKSKHVECGKTQALYNARLKEIADREAKRLERIGDVDKLTPPDTAKTPVMRAYAIHFKDIHTAQTKRSLKTGKPIDISRLDMMTAVRLRMTGYSREDVHTAIMVMSPSLRSELGKDPNAHKWDDYAARTTAAVFGYYGDREAKKLERFIEHWQDLEAPTKTVVPEKPLSAEADQKRLAELRRLRDEAAEAYADPIMEKEKHEKLAAIAAQRPKAEEALRDARSALEAHEETDVELTFFERTFGGKSADAKIATYHKRTAELSGEVKRREAVIADLDYKERNPFEGRGANRRKQLEATGRAVYDKTHPDETRERETLEELYDKNLLYLNYTANPVSQSGQHEHQKGLAARVFEIEASRGLTEAETIAKHEGVRNVFEITEKYRGRDVGRNDKGIGR